MKRFDLKTVSRRVVTSTAITVLFQGIQFFSYDLTAFTLRYGTGDQNLHTGAGGI